jgi:tRNA (guanine-N7-)-methyltransferase
MRRLRQHVNPLKASSLAPRPAALAIPDGPEVEVELGCGDAAFLIERAQAHPDRLFYGIDIRDSFLEPARAAIAELGLENLELCVSNLIVDADRLFLPGRLSRIHINFPDPWFKRRHHNRRWLSPTSTEHLARALAPRGELFFQSDVFEPALEALALFEGCPLLENTAGEWRFLRESPFAERSGRERSCLAEGLRIWRLLFVLRDDAGADSPEEPFD